MTVITTMRTQIKRKCECRKRLYKNHTLVLKISTTLDHYTIQQDIPNIWEPSIVCYKTGRVEFPDLRSKIEDLVKTMANEGFWFEYKFIAPSIVQEIQYEIWNIGSDSVPEQLFPRNL